MPKVKDFKETPKDLAGKAISMDRLQELIRGLNKIAYSELVDNQETLDAKAKLAKLQKINRNFCD